MPWSEFVATRPAWSVTRAPGSPPPRRMPQRRNLRQPGRRPPQAGTMALRRRQSLAGIAEQSTAGQRSGRIPRWATRPRQKRAQRLNYLAAPRPARLPDSKPTTIQPKDSRYERGTTGAGQSDSQQRPWFISRAIPLKESMRQQSKEIQCHPELVIARRRGMIFADAVDLYLAAKATEFSNDKHRA